MADTEPERSQSDELIIDPRQPSSKWRFACPRGHTALVPSGDSVWCQSCSHDLDVQEAYYERIVDKLEDRDVAWSDVEVLETGSEVDAY